jgi:hypothetical protein
VTVAWPASNESPPRRREGEVIRIDSTMKGPPFLGNKGVFLERHERPPVKEPIRFSTAFCVWLHIGGPLF